ncbi:MAG: DedA family protein [Pseudomonadota bacterium]|nr:DedA family protein [Pseudomonadota bacterium]
MKDFLNNGFLKIVENCKRKNSRIILYFVSFIESIIFPIPTDIFLIPYVLANRSNYLIITLYTTLYSVLGGVCAFYIGLFFWDYFSEILVQYYPSIINGVEGFKKDFVIYGNLLILLGGFSPFPYKVTCISSGLLGLGITQFVIFSSISRFLRFFIVAYFFYRFGEKAKFMINKYIYLISLAFIFILLIYILIH